MKVAVRAALAFALLAGFYLLVALIAGGAVAVDVLAMTHLSGAAIKLAVVLTIATFALLRGLFIVNRRKEGEQPGVAVGREHEPLLWRTVEELAQRVHTRPPDEIRLVAEVNAAVGEDTSWLGLRVTKRRMYIGVPLLMALTVDEMRAVLGHELGHYSAAHTRLGAPVYRGRVAVLAAVQSLGNHPFIQKIFVLYAKLFLRVSQAVSREQELEADRFAVAIGGREAAAGALRKVRGTSVAWDFYMDRYLGLTGLGGVRPADVFGGFEALINSPERQAEIAQVAEEKEETSPYDSHPSLQDRLAAIALLPDPPHRADPRPASTLLQNPPLAAGAVERSFWTEEALRLQPVSWEEMIARGMYWAVNHEALADIAVAGQRIVGADQPYLDSALEALARGQGQALHDGLVQLGWQPAPDLVTQVLTRALEGALINFGRARWTLSWSGPAVLLDLAGNEVKLDEYAAQLAMNPGAVAGLRSWLVQAGVPADYRPVLPPDPAPVPTPPRG